jgi:hypothetical protein
MDTIDRLIADGERLEASMYMEMGAWWSKVPEVEFRAFATSAVECLKQLAGERSEYFRMLQLQQLPRGLAKPGFERITMPSIVGSLKALRTSLETAKS